MLYHIQQYFHIGNWAEWLFNYIVHLGTFFLGNSSNFLKLTTMDIYFFFSIIYKNLHYPNILVSALPEFWLWKLRALTVSGQHSCRLQWLPGQAARWSGWGSSRPPSPGPHRRALSGCRRYPWCLVTLSWP